MSQRTEYLLVVLMSLGLAGAVFFLIGRSPSIHGIPR